MPVTSSCCGVISSPWQGLSFLSAYFGVILQHMSREGKIWDRFDWMIKTHRRLKRILFLIARMHFVSYCPIIKSALFILLCVLIWSMAVSNHLGPLGQTMNHTKAQNSLMHLRFHLQCICSTFVVIGKIIIIKIRSTWFQKFVPVCVVLVFHVCLHLCNF